jgi:hypothetical protein
MLRPSGDHFGVYPRARRRVARPLSRRSTWIQSCSSNSRRVPSGDHERSVRSCRATTVAPSSTFGTWNRSRGLLPSRPATNTPSPSEGIRPTNASSAPFGDQAGSELHEARGTSRRSCAPSRRRTKTFGPTFPRRVERAKASDAPSGDHAGKKSRAPRVRRRRPLPSLPTT